MILVDVDRTYIVYTNIFGSNGIAVSQHIQPFYVEFRYFFSLIGDLARLLYFHTRQLPYYIFGYQIVAVPVTIDSVCQRITLSFHSRDSGFYDDFIYFQHIFSHLKIEYPGFIFDYFRGLCYIDGGYHNSEGIRRKLSLKRIPTVRISHSVSEYAVHVDILDYDVGKLDRFASMNVSNPTAYFRLRIGDVAEQYE